MQLTREEILKKLKEILMTADDKNPEVVENCTEDTRLGTDLALSSVGMLFLVISIEETFGIRFQNVSIADFLTVGSVIDYIESKLN